MEIRPTKGEAVPLPLPAMAPRTHKSLATYYCWADLLHGPDGRAGTLLWHDQMNETDAIGATVQMLPDAVVVAVRKRNGVTVRAHLPGGIA